MAAANEEVNGQVFNLGGDCVISLKDLGELLVDVNGGGEYAVKVFRRWKTIDIGDYYADFSQIRSVWTENPRCRSGKASRGHSRSSQAS